MHVRLDMAMHIPIAGIRGPEPGYDISPLRHHYRVFERRLARHAPVHSIASPEVIVGARFQHLHQIAVDM